MDEVRRKRLAEERLDTSSLSAVEGSSEEFEVSLEAGMKLGKGEKKG